MTSKRVKLSASTAWENEGLLLKHAAIQKTEKLVEWIKKDEAEKKRQYVQRLVQERKAKRAEFLAKLVKKQAKLQDSMNKLRAYDKMQGESLLKDPTYYTLEFVAKGFPPQEMPPAPGKTLMTFGTFGAVAPTLMTEGDRALLLDVGAPLNSTLMDWWAQSVKKRSGAQQKLWQVRFFTPELMLPLSQWAERNGGQTLAGFCNGEWCVVDFTTKRCTAYSSELSGGVCEKIKEVFGITAFADFAVENTCPILPVLAPIDKSVFAAAFAEAFLCGQPMPQQVVVADYKAKMLKQLDEDIVEECALGG